MDDPGKNPSRTYHRPKFKMAAFKNNKCANILQIPYNFVDFRIITSKNRQRKHSEPKKV